MANVRRTSINLDLELVDKAKQALGTSGTTETVHRALEEAWRREALKRLAEWRFDVDEQGMLASAATRALRDIGTKLVTESLDGVRSNLESGRHGVATVGE